MSNEQAVIVRSTLTQHESDVLFPQLEALENELISTINAVGLGEFDGNEIGGGELVLYMYGPDAERLFVAVAPVLRRSALTRGGIASIRPGPPGAKDRSVHLSAH
jgi:hypothetical protein